MTPAVNVTPQASGGQSTPTAFIPRPSPDVGGLTVYLSGFYGADGEDRRAPLLARFLRLDVWGSSLLSSRARVEMGGAAVILLVVFLFELVAWSMIFNIALRGGATGFGLGTLVAFAPGLLFATAVFTFERGIMTSDFDGRSRRVYSAIAMRVLIVLLSAFATAQPVELAFFQHEIDERLRDEELRRLALAANHVPTAQETQASQAAAGRQAVANLQAEGMHMDVDAAQGRLARVEADIQQHTGSASPTYLTHLHEELDRARERRASADRRLRRNGITAEEQDAARRAVEAATDQVERLEREQRRQSSTHEQWETRRRALVDDRNAANAAVVAAELRWNALVAQRIGGLLQHPDAVRADEDMTWFRRIRSAEPGVPVTEVISGERREFNPYRVGFVRRITVLGELRDGLPPAWPPSDETTRSTAATRFDLKDLSPGDFLAERRAARRRESFQQVYRIAFVIASVIPLLSLGFKLLFARELSAYYSARRQAKAGNSDAAEVEAVTGLGHG